MSESKVVNNIQANLFTHAYVEKYVNTFNELFEMTEDGALKSSRDTLEKVEVWFNSTHMLMSLITGINLLPVNFEIENGKSKANEQTLLHVYSISYTVLMRMSQMVNRQILERNPQEVKEVVEKK